MRPSLFAGTRQLSADQRYHALSHVYSFLPGFNTGAIRFRNAAGADTGAFNAIGLQKGGTIVPAKPAHRPDDAGGNAPFGLNDVKGAFDILVNVRVFDDSRG
jgi:hypothetical protein